MHTDQDIAWRRKTAVGSEGSRVDVSRGGWRERVRSKPGLGHAYRVGVFAVGLLFIALGFALAVLPGPLTIPPVLIGLWIWSTEFRFAERSSIPSSARPTTRGSTLKPAPSVRPPSQSAASQRPAQRRGQSPTSSSSPKDKKPSACKTLPRTQRSV